MVAAPEVRQHQTVSSLPRTLGEYQLVRPLGQGGAAQVYLATRPQDFGWVVVKLLRPELIEVPRALQRFEQESQIAVRVDHPSLIRVLDVGLVDEQPFIAMDLVEGAPLSTVLQAASQAKRQIPVRVALGIIRSVADGLDALHRAEDPETGRPFGFVHRDVAPKNVMVTRDFRAVLIDFGIGKSNLRPWQTALKARLGSPGYMSPEQLQGSAVDHRSDLFNLGVLAFELLTVEPLLERGSFSDMFESALKAQYRSLTEMRPELGEAAEKVVVRMLAPDPERRYGSGWDFVAALEAALLPLGPLDDGNAQWLEEVIVDYCREKIPPPPIHADTGHDGRTEQTRVIARRDFEADSSTFSGASGESLGMSASTSVGVPALPPEGPSSDPATIPMSPSLALPEFEELQETLPLLGGDIMRTRAEAVEVSVDPDEAPTLLPYGSPGVKPLQPTPDPEAHEATQHASLESNDPPPEASSVEPAPDPASTMPLRELSQALMSPAGTVKLGAKPRLSSSGGTTSPLAMTLGMGIAIILGVLLASVGVRLWQSTVVPVEVPTEPVRTAEP